MHGYCKTILGWYDMTKLVRIEIIPISIPYDIHASYEPKVNLGPNTRARLI
jgi:hypothetical protein